MSEQIQRIWDPFIRCFHWSVVVLYFSNHFFIEGESDLHELIGYILLILVLLRIIWGFVGPKTAQFKNFWPSKAGIQHHIENLKKRQFDPTEGHNPLGGLMILFLLTTLLITGITGWMLEWEMFWGEEWLEAIHDTTSYIILFAVIIHVIAILILSRLSKINLISTMITGNRKVNSGNNDPKKR